MDGKINILLVDDREENLTALEALIRRDDINLFKTTSGNQALKLAWEKNVSIALIDVQMPEMDGFELVQLLKSNPRTRGILVIFVTAISTENKYAIKGYKEGAIDYLYKPLDPFVTAAKVDAFIRLARAQKDIELKNKELETYAMIVQNSGDLIVELGISHFQVKNINPTVKRLFGYEPKDIIGTGFLNLCAEAGSETSRHLNSMVRLKDSFRNFEDRFVNAKREIIWLDCRVTLKDESLFLNMNDITLRKEYTDELLRSREMADQARKFKESFLANMSHEIRTPINSIMALSQILTTSDLQEEQRKMLKLITLSSNSLLGIINDVLDISKIEAGKFSIVRTETNISTLVSSVCDMLQYQAEEKGIELKCHIDPKLPRLVLADSLRLSQIMTNLASNAVKFTEKGHVILHLKLLATKGDKAHISFAIEDTGTGIAEDKLSSIFESFTQASDNIQHKFGGTGLGLSIVSGLGSLKGGELKVSSKLGKGSVFSFENWYTVIAHIELTETESITTPEEIIPFEPALKVLLAEDNKVNQFAATHILKKWNCQIDIAETGEEVLEKLNYNHYEIILMDTHMPKMNGNEATRKIRTEFKEPKCSIPIISLSAAVLENEVNLAWEAGVSDVVSKPFQPDELYAKMKKLVRKS